MPLDSGSIPESYSASKPGILLIHGLTGMPLEMRPLEKHFRKLGFDVENILLAGHGAGHEELFKAKAEDWLSSARAGLSRLLERNQQAVICGLSMGAMISAALSAENKQVIGNIMLSPTIYYDAAKMSGNSLSHTVNSKAVSRMMAALCRAVPMVGRHFYWEETPPYGLRDERLQRQITKAIEESKKGSGNDFGTFRTYFGPLAQMMSLVFAAEKQLPSVTCPSLVVHSLEDTIASIDNATTCYAGLGSKMKTLVFLTGCDHVMTLDLQKNKLQALVETFINGLSQNSEQGLSRGLGQALSVASSSKANSELSVSVNPEPHGVDRHSLTLRFADQAIFRVPLYVSCYELTAQPGSMLSKFAGILHNFAPSLFRPKALKLGVFEGSRELDAALSAQARISHNPAMIESAQKHVLATIDSLGQALDIDLVAINTGLSRQLLTKKDSGEIMKPAYQSSWASGLVAAAQTNTNVLKHRNSVLDWLVNRKPEELTFAPSLEPIEATMESVLA